MRQIPALHIFLLFPQRESKDGLPLSHVLQFNGKPPQQQDREHCSPTEPPHEVGRVHQELVPGRVVGAGGARAALLSLLVGGIL